MRKLQNFHNFERVPRVALRAHFDFIFVKTLSDFNVFPCFVDNST